jgi:hypothetical protein
MVEEEAVVDEVEVLVLVEVEAEVEVVKVAVAEGEVGVKAKVGVAVVEAATATHQDVHPLVRRRLGIIPHERRALLQKSQRHRP